MLKTRTLKNGLEVIVVESHGVPLATVEVDVRNGAFTQTPEFAGLAHLYEHMFFRANQRFGQPDQTLERASELGAVFNDIESGRNAITWWVGWIERKGRPVAYFALNLDPTSRTVFADRFAIARAILAEAGALPSGFPPA